MIFTRMKLALAGLLLVTTAPLANADLIDFAGYAQRPPNTEKAYDFGAEITPSTVANPTSIKVNLYAWLNTGGIPVVGNRPLPTTASTTANWFHRRFVRG